MDLSTITEPQIIKIDDKTSIKYTVIKEKIDLDILKREKEQLGTQLNQSEPSEKDLIELGRFNHPYYQNNRTSIEKKIADIDKILNG